MDHVERVNTTELENCSLEFTPWAFVSRESCQECLREVAALHARRKRENDDIARLDSQNIPPNSPCFIISSDWLRSWLSFSRGATDDPPGPIFNDTLFEKSDAAEDRAKRQVRSGLQRSVHYRAVNQDIWRYLQGVYGGGPTIPRKSVNIYGEVYRDFNNTDDLDVEGL